jgi:hypothetical protein
MGSRPLGVREPVYVPGLPVLVVGGPLLSALVADPARHAPLVQCRCNARGLGRKTKLGQPDPTLRAIPGAHGCARAKTVHTSSGSACDGAFPTPISRTPGAPSSGRSARLGPGSPGTGVLRRTWRRDRRSGRDQNDRPRRAAGVISVRRRASARAAGIGPAAEAVEEGEAHRRRGNQRQGYEDSVRPADEHADRKAERE